MTYLIPVYDGPDLQGYVGTSDPNQAAGGVPVAFIVGFRGASKIQTTGFDVTATAKIVVGTNPSRRTVTIQNLGSSDVYIGGEDVNTTNGYKIAANGAITLELAGELWAVTASTTENIRVLTEVDA